jgi:hypothetical protein
MISIARILNAAASCALFACAAFFSSAAWAQAGYVHEIFGTVSIQRTAAKAVPAKVGDTFDAETVFRTGSDGKIVLKFADGQVVALGADSALRIGTYRYVANDLKQSTSSLDFMRGEMRFVTGLIGATNREGIHITAGDSVVGILNPGGADFTVLVNPEPKEVGAAVVARGEISVRTPYGPIYKVEAGQYAPWQPGEAPQPPLPVAAAPAVIQAAVAGLWALVVPSSAPVVVSAAARMAVVAAAASMAQAAASADPKQAGYVDAVSSTVTLRTSSGKTTNASIGDIFQAGTTVNTGSDGQVALKFADGQVVVLGPGSILGVDQYQFDPANIKASRSALDLANGVMRYFSGVIHADNHDGISIAAGASLIDILNTGAADFTVAVNTQNQEVGVAAVAAGEISVRTPYGPISKVETGQAAPWQPGGAQPATPLAAASASIQAAVAALAAVATPEITPVVVQSAAFAATAVAASDRAQAAASADPANRRLQAAAQAAAEQATAATQAATAAAQAIAATLFASALAALPATAAGEAQAQVPAAPPIALPLAPITPTVTPGGGVLRTCTGSPC